MKHLMYILASTAFLASWAPAGEASVPDNLRVYLLIGQSNMAGRAPVEEDDRAPVERAFLFDSDGRWVPATNPLNRYSSVRKALDMQRLGPGYTFARRMTEFLPDENVGLVVNARGGTRIEEWAEGTELYREAVLRTREAVRSGGELKGILWHQGEGNSRDPDYLDKLTALIEALRRDLESPELPFVAGQVEGERPVNRLLAKLPDAVDATACVSSSALATYDGTHFDAASTRELGHRYAAEIIRLEEHADRVGREISLFDGETFAGWEGGDEEYFRIEDGAIVCGILDQQVPRNQFLSTKRSFRDFELRLQFKLTGADRVNSGVQFRSWRIPNHYAVTGYQADLGNPDWWGAIYDEHRRNRLLARPNMEELGRVLRIGEWNDYVIRAEGRRIQLWINGVRTVDYTEPDEGIDESGVIALQIHRMAPGEAWFRDIFIRELPATKTTMNAANPIMPGADPHAIVIDDTVWMYPTQRSGEGLFFAHFSADLVDWETHGPVLRFSEIDWIPRGKHAWAPALEVRDGRYFFYYSVGPKPSHIGVATGDSPAGPFVDSGRALLSDHGEPGFEAIDPMVFTDPVSGKSYLYAGGSAGSTLRVFEMNDDMISFRREIEVETPERFTEGAFMHYRDGLYHFTYSHGHWRAASYSVHHSTAPSPTGPWTYRGPILTSDHRHKGPGHHSVIQNPHTGEWLIVYHRWNDREGNGPFRGYREVAIDRLVHEEDGSIRPVVMTDEGVPSWRRDEASRR